MWVVGVVPTSKFHVGRWLCFLLLSLDFHGALGMLSTLFRDIGWGVSQPTRHTLTSDAHTLPRYTPRTSYPHIRLLDTH